MAKSTAHYQMRLISFRIKNFKSIIDTGECNLSEKDNIIILVGQNEAGKSAVVEALDLFGNGPSEDFERLQKRQEEHAQVFCNFILEDPDIEYIAPLINNVKAKKILKKQRVIGFIRGEPDKDAFDEINFTEETRSALSALFPEEAGANQEEEDTHTVEPSNTEENSEAEDKEKIKTIEDLEQKLFELTRSFTFFDSFEDLLPGEVKIQEISKNPAVKDFQKVFGVNFADVVKKGNRAITREELRLNGLASDDLNIYWTQKLEQDSKYNFNVKIVPQTDESLSRVEFKVDRDDGDPLFLEQKSKGFRWFSAFNLRLRALGVNEEEIKDLVILIDEPGQGLHEKAQRDVKKVIEELSNEGAQIIYATHNPNLIGTEGKEFARIRIVSNSKALGTKIDTVAQFAAKSDPGALDALSPLVTAMGLHSVQAVFDSQRLNIVVEGITDHYYFNALKKLLGKDERLYFLPACGVNNVPNLVSVLIGWGCNYKAVFDDDKDSGKKAYNALKREFYENNDTATKEHVYQLNGCHGIEDIFDRSDFNKFVLNQPGLRRRIVDTNSRLAVDKKETLARTFLERVDSGNFQLNTISLRRINKVFNWLYEKFGISTQDPS